MGLYMHNQYLISGFPQMTSGLRTADSRMKLKPSIIIIMEFRERLRIDCTVIGILPVRGVGTPIAECVHRPL